MYVCLCVWGRTCDNSGLCGHLFVKDAILYESHIHFHWTGDEPMDGSSYPTPLELPSLSIPGASFLFKEINTFSCMNGHIKGKSKRQGVTVLWFGRVYITFILIVMTYSAFLLSVYNFVPFPQWPLSLPLRFVCFSWKPEYLETQSKMLMRI